MGKRKWESEREARENRKVAKRPGRTSDGSRYERSPVSTELIVSAGQFTTIYVVEVDCIMHDGFGACCYRAPAKRIRRDQLAGPRWRSHSSAAWRRFSR